MKHPGSWHPGHLSKPWFMALLVLLMVGAKSTSVFAQAAQPWLADRQETRGAGIRSGNLEWHPGVAGEIGYDSNFFQGSGSTSEPLVPSVRLRLTPSLSLETLGKARTEAGGAQTAAPKAVFKSQLALSIDRLFALESESAEQVNRTHLGASLGAQVGILPEAPWGADLDANYTRVEQPYNAPGSVSLDRSVVHGGGALRWRPRGGLLEWNWGYDGTLTTFDQPEYALDSVTHGFRTRGTWRFLPRTGLLYLGDVGFVARRSLDSRLPNLMPVSSQLGVNGLITNSFGVLLLGGWKSIFSDPMPNGVLQELDTPIGRAEVTWFVDKQTELPSDEGSAGFSTVRAGFLHDGFASELSSYYKIDKGYLTVSAMLGGLVFLHASGGLSYVRHARPLDENGVQLSNRSIKEWRQEVELYVEYRLAKTLSLFSNNGFSASPRGNTINIGDGTDSLKYRRFTALVGVRWFL